MNEATYYGFVECYFTDQPELLSYKLMTGKDLSCTPAAVLGDLNHVHWPNSINELDGMSIGASDLKLQKGLLPEVAGTATTERADAVSP